MCEASQEDEEIYKREKPRFLYLKMFHDAVG